MKEIKYSFIALALAGMAGMQSCQNDFDDPGLQVPVATLQPNKTLAEFKLAYQNDDAVLLSEEGEPAIISGRVISTDVSGNIYKSLVIQDETSALTLSINRASLYEDFHLGQEVVINTAGLWIGKYNDLIQLGWLGEYNGAPQMTFMSYAEFATHTELNGLPVTETEYIMPGDERPADKMYCLIEQIDQLPMSGEEMYKLQGQLVEFRNAQFVDGGKETFAPSQESVSRYITQDGNSQQLVVRNSGYSTFFNDMLPEGTGTVRGILSWYGGTWQLLLRTIDDVIFNEHGTQADPYTLEEAIEMQGEGIRGWTEGYIVGSVAAGFSNDTPVTSNSDIIFSSEAELPNNLVIGPTADCTDFTKCVVVELKADSQFRQYGNLLDNPAVYKKSIKLYGTFANVWGMAGVADNSGSAAEFEIDGVKLPDNPDNPNPGGSGTGTKEDPFSVAGVVAGTATGSDVWVEGYIVGYIPDKYISEAVFSNQGVTSQTNILIAPSADCTDANQCVPVQLPAGNLRTELSLMGNPSGYKKLVKIRGSIEKYFGVNGLKSPTEYAWSDGSGTTPVDPNPPVAGSGAGTQADPYTVSGIVAGTTTGSDVWVTGYIVGYIPTQYYTDAVFSNDGNASKTNILLAPTADCTDASQCIPVQLPSTGDFRDALSLLNNPSGYKKQIKIRGNIEKYFGVPGLKSPTEYEWVEGGGTTTPDQPGTGDAAGTETDPFSVASIIAGTASGSDVWAEGYVVGFVPGMTYSDAVLSNDVTGKDYTNTNLVLGPTADCTDLSKCIPVQLPAGVRAELGLGNNPDVYKKHVKLKGEVAKYFGQPGFKSVSEYVIE